MPFSRTEQTAILRLGLLAGFVIAVDEVVSLKGTVISIDYTTGLGFMLLAMLGMIFSVYVHESAHKYAAKSIGYFTHITSYSWGLVVGGALSLFSFGWIQFFTPNACDLEADPRARIAKFRKYENWKQEAFIAGFGLLASALLAILFHFVYAFTELEIIRTLMLGNLLLLIYSLIPFELLTLYNLRFMQKIDQLPQSDGLYLLHYSLFAWVFFSVFALVLAVLLYFFQTAGISIAFGIALATMLTVWYNFFKSS
jgi:hypothetical protein